METAVRRSDRAPGWEHPRARWENSRFWCVGRILLKRARSVARSNASPASRTGAEDNCTLAACAAASLARKYPYIPRIVYDHHPSDAGRDFLEQLQPLPSKRVLKIG